MHFNIWNFLNLTLKKEIWNPFIFSQNSAIYYSFVFSICSFKSFGHILKKQQKDLWDI